MQKELEKHLLHYVLGFFNRIENWLRPIKSYMDACNKVVLWDCLRSLLHMQKRQCDSFHCSCSVSDAECMGRKKLAKKNPDGNIMQHCLPLGKKPPQNSTVLEPLQGCGQPKGDHAWLVTSPTKTSWSVFVQVCRRVQELDVHDEV